MSYTQTQWKNGDIITKDKLNKIEDGIYDIDRRITNNTINIDNLVRQIREIPGGAHALTANLSADMTDQTAIYVYTGSETGYTFGHWYYYDDSNWSDGGVYTNIETDASLSVAGMAADAKVTGYEISDLKSTIDDIRDATISDKSIPLGSTTRGWWDISNDVASISAQSTGSVYAFQAVEVTPEKQYRISIYASNNHAPIILANYTNNEYNVVSSINVQSTGRQTFVINVPADVTHILLTKYGTQSASVVYSVEKTDKTLSLENVSADAKKTGEEISQLKSLFTLKDDSAQFNSTHYIGASSGNYKSNSGSPGYFANQNFIDVSEMNYTVFMTSAGYEYRIFYYSSASESSFIGKGNYTTGNIETKLTGTFESQTYRYVRFNIHKDGSSSNDDFSETSSAFRLYSVSAKNFAKEDKMLLQTTRCASVSMYEKWGVIGASRDCGYIYKENGGSVVTRRNLSWGSVLARNAGNVCNNYAYAGASTVTWITNNNYGLPKVLADDPCQMYVMALGTNDANHPLEQDLGSTSNVHDTIEEYTSGDLETTYGAYSYILLNLIDHAPDAHIICLFRYTPEDGEDYLNVWTAVQYIADRYGLPIMNWCDSYTHQKYVYPAEYRYGSHPVAVGYAAMANCFEELYADCVADNWEYFSHYTG